MNPPTISVVRGRVGLPAPQSSSVAFAPQRFATHAGSRRRSTISRPLTRTSHEPAETQMRRVWSCLDPRAGAGGHRASRYVPEMRRRTCPGRRGAAWFGVSDRIDGRDVDVGALPRGPEARTAARGALSTPDRWGLQILLAYPPTAGWSAPPVDPIICRYGDSVRWRSLQQPGLALHRMPLRLGPAGGRAPPQRRTMPQL